MDQDLLKLLENAGFTEKEAKVYLALLELGQGDVSDIAKISGLKRSIIYVILEGLLKRGYVSEMLNKKINTYQAIDPTVILSQLKTVTKNFSEMLPIFRTLHNKGGKRPKISYFETKEGIWNIYEEMNQTENCFFITSYQRIEKHFPASTEKWIANYEKGLYRIKGKHLIPDNLRDIEIGKEFSKIKQKVRVIEDLKNIEMDFAIFGKKVAITSLSEEPFIVVMESEGLVNSLKPIFEIAWAKGKDII